MFQHSARRILMALPLALALACSLAAQSPETLERQKVETESWRARAQRGEPAAQYEMGLRCEAGIGIDEDLGEAMAWWQKAAEQGQTDAQLMLAAKYQTGEFGGLVDYVQAAKWFRKVAETGNEFAMRALGDLYANGQGVAKDPREAAAWYLAAAKKGEAQAVARMVEIYGRGIGVRGDAIEAYAWAGVAAWTHSDLAKQQGMLTKLRARLSANLQEKANNRATEIIAEIRKGL